MAQTLRMNLFLTNPHATRGRHEGMKLVSTLDISIRGQAPVGNKYEYLLSLPFIKGDLEGFYKENKKIPPAPFRKGGE